MRFSNRHHAGQLLARALQPYLKMPATVYALPRGGVPVGAEIALASGIPLDLVIPRKIGHPQHPEYAIGAVTETGTPILGDGNHMLPSSGWLEATIKREKAEARRRRQLYCSGLPRHSAAGQQAILVDDGIATGLTMLAAIAELRQDVPAELIVAVPVAPAEAVGRFSPLVDPFVAVQVPAVYAGAVGYYYDDFRQLNDQEVLDELQRLRRAQPSPGTGQRRAAP